MSILHKIALAAAMAVCSGPGGANPPIEAPAPSGRWRGDYAKAPSCPAGVRTVRVQFDYAAQSVLAAEVSVRQQTQLSVYMPTDTAGDTGSLFCPLAAGEAVAGRDVIHVKIEDPKFSYQPVLVRIVKATELFVEPAPGG